jgi:short subunit fatty acids transporter
MFQNLQTWHIIAIVLGIFAVVAIAVYMMKGNKDDKNADKEEKNEAGNEEKNESENDEKNESGNKEEKQAEFSHLTKMINASSGNRLITSSSGGESSASVVVDNLFKELGMALCNKPIEYKKRQELYDNLYRKIKIPINAGMLNLYVFLSDKLTLAQKKDFIASLTFLQQEEIKNLAEEGSDAEKAKIREMKKNKVTLLANGNVQCTGFIKKTFCDDKDQISVSDFGNNLYNYVSTGWDTEKVREITYKEQKARFPNASEETIQAEVSKIVQGHTQFMNNLRNKIINSLCESY